MMQTPQIIQPTVSAVLKLKFRVSELHLSEFVRILFLLTMLSSIETSPVVYF